jgi:endonuclease III
MVDIEEQRRLTRALLNRFGRGFAEECGVHVTSNPASLLHLLCLSVLLARSDDYHRAASTTRAMRDRGWENATRLARADQQERTRVIRDQGWPRADELANALGGLADAVIEQYHGDLRRLRNKAGHDPTRERQELVRLPGVDDRVVDLFFRDVQVVWHEVAPFADRRALAAAHRLGLGESTADLATRAGSADSERLAWLVGALNRVDLDDRYDEVRSAARVGAPA